MMITTLTESDLKDCKKKINSVLGDFTLGHLRSWQDVYDKLGVPQELRNLTALTSLELNYKSVKRILWLTTVDMLSYKTETTNQNEQDALIESQIYEYYFKSNSPTALETLHLDVSKCEANKEQESQDDSEAISALQIPCESPKQCVTLFSNQLECALKLYYGIVEKKHRGQLLLGATGDGKTFVLGQICRWLIDTKFLDGKTLSPWRLLYVTKAPIIEQTERVIANMFGIDTDRMEVVVINIEQLRSKLGSYMIKEHTIVKQGEVYIEYEWIHPLYPCIIFFDECQTVKNERSTQSKLLQAYNDIPEKLTKHTYLIMSSATPFANVAEAKVFAVSTRIPAVHFAGYSTPLNNKNWPQFAAEIAHPASPLEFCEAAVERLMDKLDPYIVRLKGSRWQFKARNQVKLTSFKTLEQKRTYDAAWERYVEELAKINRDEPGGQFAILAKFTKFAQAAELVRSDDLPQAMYECEKGGLAPVCAVKFKASIAKIISKLVLDYGVPRSKISVIWGGDSSLNRKPLTKEQAEELFKRIMSGEVISKSLLEKLEDYLIHKDDTPEERKAHEKELEMYRQLGLGPQSRQERQNNLDNFQKGKSLYLFYTFKAGGAGISAHHTDELTKDWNRNHPDFTKWFEKISALPKSKQPLPGKVRRKESGYAVEEDIPFIPTRQRATFVAFTYSLPEFIQGIGRVPRRTSLSETSQLMLAYRGTIEEHILARLMSKMKCHNKVVKGNMSDIMGDVNTYTKSYKHRQLEEQVDKKLLEMNKDEVIDIDSENLDIIEEDEDE